MKKFFSFAFLLIFASMMAACNTVQGLGKDVQKVGEKVEGAAKK